MGYLAIYTTFYLPYSVVSILWEAWNWDTISAGNSFGIRRLGTPRMRGNSNEIHIRRVGYEDGKCTELVCTLICSRHFAKEQTDTNTKYIYDDRWVILNSMNKRNWTSCEDFGWSFTIKVFQGPILNADLVHLTSHIRRLSCRYQLSRTWNWVISIWVPLN